MITYSGIRFDPLDPRPGDVAIEDIAHQLGYQCRYNGAVREYYSIAEHSVLASEHVPSAFALEALLHDAAEAYVGDMIRPIKIRDDMAYYRAVEARVQDAIHARFGIVVTEESRGAIKKVDDALIIDEAVALLPDPGYYVGRYGSARTGVGARIQALSPARAELMFLLRYHEVTG
jgi:hypothetical protein